MSCNKRMSAKLLRYLKYIYMSVMNVELNNYKRKNCTIRKQLESERILVCCELERTQTKECFVSLQFRDIVVTIQMLFYEIFSY